MINEEKIIFETYYMTFKYKVLSWVKINYLNENYKWTQDGAPIHTARKIQDFCKSNLLDCSIEHPTAMSSFSKFLNVEFTHFYYALSCDK